MKLLYRLSQTWLWQFIFIMPIAVLVFPFPLIIPAMITGMVIDQPDEWPLIPAYILLCIGGLFTFWMEDKYKNTY